MEGGVVVLRNEESTIIFPSCSLRGGIHYMAARETDRGEKTQREKDMEIQEKKEVIQSAVNVITEETCMH